MADKLIPTRDHVLAAFASIKADKDEQAFKHHRPLSLVEVGAEILELERNYRHVLTLADLRVELHEPILRRLLGELATTGELVAATGGEWRDRKISIYGGNPRSTYYALPEHDAAWKQEEAAHKEKFRLMAANDHARRALAARHPQEHAALREEYLKDHPAN